MNSMKQSLNLVSLFIGFTDLPKVKSQISLNEFCCLAGSNAAIVTDYSLEIS